MPAFETGDTPPALQGAAAIGDGRGGFVIEPVSVRAPQAGEVRVRLTAAGICHTDHASLHWPGPLVLGHEGAGVVESLGPGVAEQQPQLRPGQPVLLNWAIPCGRCPQCRRGRSSLCERTHGVDATLGHSEPAAGHTLWRGQPVQRSFRLGTFAEHTLVRAEALTALPAALQRAVAVGATHTLEPAADDAQGEALAAAVRALTDGRGADHAFEATGVAALAFLPLKLCRNGGNALQLSGAHGPVSVEMPQFWWDKRYLVPLYGGCLPERDFPRLFDWAARCELVLDSLVTHTYRLDELGQALDDMLAGRSGKGVILLD